MLRCRIPLGSPGPPHPPRPLLPPLDPDPPHPTPLSPPGHGCSFSAPRPLGRPGWRGGWRQGGVGQCRAGQGEGSGQITQSHMVTGGLRVPSWLIMSHARMPALVTPATACCPSHLLLPGAHHAPSHPHTCYCQVLITHRQLTRQQLEQQPLGGGVVVGGSPSDYSPERRLFFRAGDATIKWVSQVSSRDLLW